MNVTHARLTAETHLKSALPHRWEHSRSVAAVASLRAERLSLDPNVVVAAAWLHDVGYAPKLRVTGFHPIDGAMFLRRAGWPEEVCGLVAFHSCARVEAAKRGLSDALSDFRDVQGLMRDVLWTSDATTGPQGEPTDIDGRVMEVLERYGLDHVVSRCMLLIAPELECAQSRVWRADQSTQ